MKVIQYNRGYYIKTSNHEMAILRGMMKYMVWSKDWDKFAATLSSPQIRSLRRRINKGSFLRTDADRRTGKFVGEVYQGPHND